MRGIKYIILGIFFLFAFFVVGQKTLAAEDIPTGSIVINEIYPNINTGEIEWIEFFNYGEKDIRLDGWSLCDNTCKPGETGFVFDDKYQIQSNGYLVIEKSVDFKFGLNDAGDILILRDDQGSEIDKIVYGDYEVNENSTNAPKPKKGESISRIPNGADSDIDSVDFKVAQITKGAENYLAVVVYETVAPKTIEEARSEENGEDVIVEGIVTATPGTISESYFYIQDATGGLQIYCYDKDFPTLIMGDRIRVAGELSSASNERRLKINMATDIQIIENSISPEPQKVAIGDISESQEGQYVKISGTVTETSGSQFVIASATGEEIKVLIRNSDVVQKPKLHKGDKVEVMGIVSQYKDDYRVLPFEEGSVKIITSYGLPVAGENGLIYIAGPIIIRKSWKLFLKAKKKLMKLPKA